MEEQPTADPQPMVALQSMETCVYPDRLEVAISVTPVHGPGAMSGREFANFLRRRPLGTLYRLVPVDGSDAAR